MDIDVDQLAAAALRLPTALRATLAERLLASLDDEAERAEHAAAWEAEFDQREQEAAAEPARVIAGAEAFGLLEADRATRRGVRG
jgi:hypothetical protein